MTENKNKFSGNGIGIGAALGVAFGFAYGGSSGNTSLSIAMGLAIGVAVGAIFDLVKSRKEFRPLSRMNGMVALNIYKSRMICKNETLNRN